MTSQHDKPKRWRPRFSVRTLVIVVTLACCYAACWGSTKRQGVEDVSRFIYGFGRDLTDSERAVLAILMESDDLPVRAPLILSQDQPKASTEGEYWFGSGRAYRRYYFWFFGYVAKLPFEREVLPGT